jgi:CheY-like chemotaxis protein
LASQPRPLDFVAAAATQDRGSPSPADKLNASDLEGSTSAGPSNPYFDASPKVSLVRTSEVKHIETHPSFRSNTDNGQVSTPSSHAKPQFVTQTVAIRLLLVDDNSVNLRMLVTYADKKGYHRLTAVNGQEAVEAYENAAHPSPNDHANTAISRTIMPIVILLDINMPVMDGFEAARRIRTFERSHNLSPATIIAVTGLGSAEARQKARASGMDLFLTKPVRPRELTGVLASIVDVCAPQAVGDVG